MPGVCCVQGDVKGCHRPLPPQKSHLEHIVWAAVLVDPLCRLALVVGACLCQHDLLKVPLIVVHVAHAHLQEKVREIKAAVMECWVRGVGVLGLVSAKVVQGH